MVWLWLLKAQNCCEVGCVQGGSVRAGGYNTVSNVTSEWAINGTQEEPGNNTARMYEVSLTPGPWKPFSGHYCRGEVFIWLGSMPTAQLGTFSIRCSPVEERNHCLLGPRPPGKLWC